MVSERDESGGEDREDEFVEDDVVIQGDSGFSAWREEGRLAGVLGIDVFNDGR